MPALTDTGVLNTAVIKVTKQCPTVHPSRCLAPFLLLCLLSRIALATSDKNPMYSRTDNGAVSGAMASSSNPYGGHKRAVSLSTNTGSPGKLGAELRDIERQNPKTSKTKTVSHPTVRNRPGLTSRNASINFSLPPNNQRGKSNLLGNGSGSVRSGIGRRVSEKRR